MAQEYQLQRGTLVERILAEDETLRDEAARLSSLAAFTVAVAAAADEPKAWAGEPRPAPAADPSPEALRAAWEELRQLLARTLEDRALALFFDRRFVAVALSGRVPVKADAGQGAIRPGDYLAAGPIPGTAIKATSPGPVIGIALEGLAAGRGPVMSLLRLGWHGGQPVRLAGGAAAADLEAKDAEIEELRRRLARLEAALAGWEPGPGAGRAEKVAAR